GGPRPAMSGPLAVLGQQGVDEGVGVKGGEVVGALAEADQLDGDAEVALDGDDDAALGGAVELGQDDPGDADGVGELAGLGEAVLAGGGVQDQQDLADLAALALQDAAEPAALLPRVCV